MMLACHRDYFNLLLGQHRIGKKGRSRKRNAKMSRNSFRTKKDWENFVAHILDI